MEPVSVIHFLKGLVEPSVFETCIETGVLSEYTCEKLFQGKGVRRFESIQGSRGHSVGGIQTNTDHGEVLGTRVVGIDENTANLDVGFGGGVRWIESV